MLRSEALVLLLLVSSHRHVTPAADQRCPGGCETEYFGQQKFVCNCPPFGYILGEESPCIWEGHGGKTYRTHHCIDAISTGFQEGTYAIAIQRLRSPTLLEGSFPNISSLRLLRILWSNVSTIQPGAFRGLHSVRNLALSNNRISRLEPDTFVGLETLLLLNLPNNAISSISPYAFRDLPRLVTLKLSNNQLTSVPVDALLQPKALTKAKLDQNNIVAISRNILRLQQNTWNLKIHVDDNKLRCDENLAWFICRLPRLQHITSNDDLKCASPAHLQGTLLTERGPDVCQTNTGRSHEGIGYTTHDDVTTPSSKHDEVTTPSSKHDEVTTPSSEHDKVTTPSSEHDEVTTQSFEHDEVNTTSAKHDNVSIPSLQNKTSATEEDTEMPYTNDMPVSQHTTEMLRVIILGGGPIINKDDNSTYTLAMIGAVFVPLLLVLASAALLFIFKRRCSACQAVPDQPTGTDEEDTEGSPNIEPYAVVYSGPDGLQASDNNSPTGSQSAPAPASADSETIQPYAVAYGDEDKGPAPEIKPYAVAYDEDQGPESDIQPYAVAYKEDAGRDDSCKIPLYATEGPDTPQAAGGCTEAGSTPQENIPNQQAAIIDPTVTQPEAGSTPQENITNHQAAIVDQPITQQEAGFTPLEINQQEAIVDQPEAGFTPQESINNQQAANVLQPVTQPEDQSPPADADKEPKCEEEEEENDQSNVLYNPAHEQPEIKDSLSNVMYNPAHGQPQSEDSTTSVLYNPANGQPESKDSTSNALYNPDHGQPESKDCTSHALYNPAHGQPRKDSTPNVLYNPALAQP
uniref:EGF-like domain-containing protein n=1 Tax=Branchiostoma floridae TaxID=7739 RepID=C3ZAV1_BRAFL|eukprot:XP_002593977.1 hypothetical protein BRAFLDRAFT_68585 [Branchiostoma floridae]